MAQYPPAVLRFHTPLVEPDVRICRIRLSDKESRVRPRKSATLRTELDEPQLLVAVLEGKACRSPPVYLVLATQPLTEPFARMVIHGTIGTVDRAIGEVVRPAAKHAVEASHDLFRFCQAPPARSSAR